MAQREKSGILSKNDKKTTDKHPDYKGDMMIEGREYWLSGWIKKSKDGRSFLSLALTPKDEQRAQRGPGGNGGNGDRRQQAGAHPDLDDRIPF